MIDPPLVFAFSAGLVAAVNPCGFAMLPAYLAYFLGTDEDDDGGGVGRALGVGAAVTAGFMVVFGVVGVAVAVLSAQIYEYLPWVTAVIGVGLVGLGVAMLAGFEPVIRLPHLDRGGAHRTIGSMFTFGVSYAVASLSCTLPVFLAVVGFDRGDVVRGVAQFAAYALAMGLVLTVATVSIALARRSLVQVLRSAGAYVGRISGGLLVLAGGYLAYYGWYQLAVLSGDLDPGGPATAVNRIQTDLLAWVSSVGAGRIGLALALTTLVAIGSVAWQRARSGARRAGDRAG